MRKIRRKWLSILLTLALLVGLMVPFAGTAVAATTYEAITNVASFNPSSVGSDNQAGATVQAKFDPYVASKDSATLIEVRDTNGKVLEIKSGTVKVLDADYNPLERIDFTSSSVSGEVYAHLERISSKTLKLTIPRDKYSSATLFVWFENFTFNGKDAANGDVSLVFFKGSGQFSGGSVVFARAKSGNVTATTLEVPAFGDGGGYVTIRFEEGLKGSIEAATDSIKIKLPSGFTWDEDTIDVELLTGNVIFGKSATDATKYSLDDERTLVLHVRQASMSGSIVEVTGWVNVDTTVAKRGNVQVTFSGKTSVTPSSLVVATYGDYGATVKSLEVKDVISGKEDQEVGKFAIEESLPGSLIARRTITFELPEKVKWVENPTFSSADSNVTGLTFKQGDTAVDVGSDKRVCKLVIDTPSQGTGSTRIVFKDAKVTVAPDYEGPIEITIGGTAGVSGKVKVGEAKRAVKVTAESKPIVAVGKQGQAVSNITITETKAENIASKVNGDTGYLTLQAPSGVKFASKPAFTVVDGNISLGDVSLAYNDTVAQVEIKSTSGSPATIKVSGIVLDLDRTVAEGDLKLKVGGNAVIENGDDFPGVDYVAQVAVATVGTPAPVETKRTAVFTIGSSTYTVNGVQYTMDVAAYVKDGRTYLPVRYVAYALGVDPENVYWDGATQTVTLLKGTTAVQLTLGSKVLKVNGISLPMDVAPELVNGRTMLPFRFIAQALGASVSYDAATQTVNMTL